MPPTILASTPLERQARPMLWLVRRPLLYIPRQITIHLADTLRTPEKRSPASPEQEIDAFVARLFRQRHAGRFHPSALRFDDYVAHEINPPLATAQQTAQPDLLPPPTMPTHTESLTGREYEVLRVAAMGLSNAEIAASLMITPGTVKWHLRNIYSKLGVRRRTQAIAAAHSRGLLLD